MPVVVHAAGACQRDHRVRGHPQLEPLGSSADASGHHALVAAHRLVDKVGHQRAVRAETTALGTGMAERGHGPAVGGPRTRDCVGQAHCGSGVSGPNLVKAIARCRAAARIWSGISTGPPIDCALIAAGAASSTIPPTKTASSALRWNTTTPLLASSTRWSEVGEGAIAVPAVLAVGIPRSFDDCCCGDDGASVVDAVDRPLVGQALQLVGPTIVECQA